MITTEEATFIALIRPCAAHMEDLVIQESFRMRNCGITFGSVNLWWDDITLELFLSQYHWSMNDYRKR